MTSTGIGLDIGGANLKAAHSAGNAISTRFELWRHLDRLAETLNQLLGKLPEWSRVGLTMTGELCDCFSCRREGVQRILGAVEGILPAQLIRCWSVRHGFVTLDHARSNYKEVASANWHALATFVGRFVRTGAALLIDIGSTTTDIIPLQDGRPIPRGWNDGDRLGEKELVYTGASRTPAFALLGNDGVIPELFATTHDAYLLLDMVAEEPTSHATADGRAATKECAHSRMARVIGRDCEQASHEVTHGLARSCFQVQRTMIAAAIEKVAIGSLSPAEPITAIVSGSGEFLAAAAWQHCQDRGIIRSGPIIRLSERIGGPQSEAGCATALAILASENDDAWK